MRIDGIELQEGSIISNLSVATGTSFPSLPNEGEMFFRTDVATEVKGMYIYSNGVWDRLISEANTPSGSVTSVAASVPAFLSVSGSPITTSGTLAITLSGTALPVANGGTGQTTSASAFNALSPITTTGDLIYSSSGTTNSRLGIGSAGQILTVSGGVPTWAAPATNGTVTSVSVTTANGVSGSVATNTTTPAITLTLGAITPSSVASTGTVTGTNLSGTNTGDQTITLTGDVTGSGTGSFASTLATVNSNAGTFASVTVNAKGLVTAAAALSGDATTSNAIITLATVNGSPQSDTFRRVTVNGKGLVTATSAVGASDINTALGYTPLNKAGDTMTGLLVLSADPTAALGAVTKQYVDNVSTGLNAHPAVATSTTAALAAATYANGVSGVGATLTANANGAISTVGGYASLIVGDRVLVKNQASTLQNGIYSVTSLGSGGTPWVLTRAAEFDNTPNGEITAGDFTYVQNGTLAGTQWVQTTVGTITVGTTGIVFSQLSGAGVITAGVGIDVTGNTVSNIGVTSLSGTTNQITASAATGSVTLSLPSSVTIGGTMTAGTFSGSGASLTSIPNGALTNSSVTVGSTNIALGATSTTLAGLTSVSSTGFTGALTGNASSATNIAGGAATQIPYQSAASTTAFSSRLTWTNASSVLTVTNGASTQTALEIRATNTLFTTISPAPGLAATNVADLSIAGADTQTTGNAGSLFLAGGTTTGTGTPGSVRISGGGASNSGGHVRIDTGVTTGSLTERLRILSNGAWSVGSTGTATGTSGQVLTSTGSTTPPGWSSTPTLTGTNFTGIPNGALTNSSVTVGSTSIALGGTATTLAGLTSVSSTGFTGALTGNASTATALATARTINGVSFDGSANITVTAAAGTLTGATLASNVLTSSLTTIGTLGSLTVTGTTTLNGSAQTFGAITSSVASPNVQLCVNLSRPSVLLTNTFLAADERTAYLRVPNTSGVAFGFHNDANSTDTDWLTATRSGQTATLVTLTTTGVNLAVGTSGLRVNGAQGTTGQILTSQGGSAAPVWGNTALSIAGGAATQIPYQAGAGSTTFSSRFTWDNATTTLLLGTSGTAVNGRVRTNTSSSGTVADLSISTGDATGTATGGSVFVQAGDNSGSGTTGQATIAGGASTTAVTAGNARLLGGTNISTGAGGSAIITGGAGGGTTNGGVVTITGGERAGAVTITGGAGLTGAVGGSVTITGGPSTDSTAGVLSLRGGGASAGGTGGAVTISTTPTTLANQAVRLTIDNAGNVMAGLTSSSGLGLLQAQTSTANIADFTSTSSGQCNVRIRSTGAFGAYAYFQNSTSGTTTADGFAIGMTDSSAALVNMENTPMVFFTNATERMRIAADGTLTIGGTAITALSATAINFGNESTAGRFYTDTAAGGRAIIGGKAQVATQVNGSTIFDVTSAGAAVTGALTTTLQVASTTNGALIIPAISARFNASNNRIGFGIANSNGFGYLGLNANPKIGSDTATYDLTQGAAQLRLDNGQYTFNLAASGTAGTDITWTSAAALHVTGGLTLGTASGVSGNSSGEIGMPNAASIRARNGSNNAWLSMMSVNASNHLVLGGLGATADTIFSNSGIGETMRLSGGNLTVRGGVSVGNATPGASGIAFPATAVAVADANTLDDYEEGTWTPSDNSGAGLTFTATEGVYTKIGNIVHLSFTVTYPATGSGVDASIGGQPFQTAAGNTAGGAVSYSTSTLQPSLLMPGSASSINPRRAIGGAPMSNADLSLATIRASVTYRAS